MAVRKDGAFFEIALSNGKFSYGRILPKAGYAFYDVYTDQPLKDIEEIAKKNILFITAVYKYAINKEVWKKIGFLELEHRLQRQPMKFIQDPIDPTQFRLYDPNTGDMIPTTREKCVGLEEAAVWEPEHIEERIVDHYEGRPNRWVKTIK